MARRLISIFTIASIAILCGCSGSAFDDRGSVPSPPYGSADDTSTYQDGEYYSITYTYYCHAGLYRAITYTSMEFYTPWEASEFTSSCISKTELPDSPEEEE